MESQESGELYEEKLAVMDSYDRHAYRIIGVCRERAVRLQKDGRSRRYGSIRRCSGLC